ncbi:hypothetical protein [Staphylococcus nepalensis]|uniref:hypothetical protein n=1 Tax=Staphylococcus nepalensis TaxID=214473 RepID=UPI000DFF95A1|nr:hypothetical protein [Staphylococcus nepalensis]SUM69877.1 Uncharacterised protein [Staphylococcus nepalensis]SUM96092.1 Uncharacterised protein [Staphylococcus nepalensis]
MRKIIMTFLTIPFTTLPIALITNDFYIGMVLSVLASYGVYMFWDAFFDEKKTESNGNC